MNFLQIIRYKNLMMIGIIQSILWFYVFPQFNIIHILSEEEFFLLMLATLFIAAGGNVVNDIYDVEIDFINKQDKVWIPHFLNAKNAWFLYALLTLFGLIFVLWVCLLIKEYWYIIWFILPVIGLFLYAFKVKKILLLNNIVISFLATYSILIVFLIENITFSSIPTNNFSLKHLFWFLTLFSFALNWIREITKDMEDLKGDHAFGVKSIPVCYGIENTKLVIQTIVFLMIGIIFGISFTYIKNQTFFVVYLILFVVSSLLFYYKQLLLAKHIRDFGKLSAILKIIMFLGLLSVFMIRF